MLLTTLHRNVVEQVLASPVSAVLGLLGLFVFLLILRVIYLRFFHPLARFPGPILASLSHIPYVLSMMSGNSHWNTLKLHRKYGPVVRTAPDELSFSTLESREDVYGFKGSRSFLKAPLYDAFVNGKSASITGIKDPVLHGKTRKFLSHPFSAKALRDHEAVVHDYCDLFVQRVGEYGAGPEGINLTKWYNWFTFDVVGDLAFGESFHCLRDVKDHFWVDLVFDHSLSIVRGDLLRRFPYLKGLLRRYIMPGIISSARRQNYQYSAEKVKARLELKTDRRDFMSYLLNQDDEDNLLNPAFLTVSASTFVVAGSETTGSALAGITYYLIKTPSIQKRLAEELLGKFSSYGDIRVDATQNLPYLNACIEEGLRMFPPAPQGPPRISPGATVSGYYVPAGTQVSSHPIVMNRDPKYFHKPDEFIPERWLEKNDQLNASQPFLIGPRACIGRNLAYMEMRALLAIVVYKFEMQLVDPTLDWDASTHVATFWEKPPLMVRFKERNSA